MDKPIEEVRADLKLLGIDTTAAVGKVLAAVHGRPPMDADLRAAAEVVRANAGIYSVESIIKREHAALVLADAIPSLLDRLAAAEALTRERQAEIIAHCDGLANKVFGAADDELPVTAEWLVVTLKAAPGLQQFRTWWQNGTLWFSAAATNYANVAMPTNNRGVVKKVIAALSPEVPSR